MKKVLFATTALVATAGMAAADVTFGGYGRFGLIYRENATGSDETNITHRFRLQIDATAESDSGISLSVHAYVSSVTLATPVRSAQTVHASSHVPAAWKLALVTSSALWNSCQVSTQSTSV